MKIKTTVLAIFLISLTAIGSDSGTNSFSVFDQTTDLITKNFYDQTFRGLPWNSLVSKARKKLSPTSSDARLESVLNQLLDRLHASHTEFLSNADQEYWALESVFSGEVDGGPLNQIGAWFISINGKWFVRNVFEDSAASLAGLLPGDEIIAVDNHLLEPVHSFDQGSQLTHAVQIRRAQNGPVQTLWVTATHESFQRSMLRATIASYMVYDMCGKKIAYFHLWAGTNDESMNALAVAAQKAAKEADSFILDLRDGFGGAYPGFLNPFFGHDDQGKPIPQIFSKPMAALINDGVRSGKEWITDILKETHRATLVGTRTKGYFLAGKVFPVVPGHFNLYLAVAKGAGPDLEGNGVYPDISVPFRLPYAAGFDPQLEKGLSLLGSLNTDGVCE